MPGSPLRSADPRPQAVWRGRFVTRIRKLPRLVDRHGGGRVSYGRETPRRTGMAGDLSVGLSCIDNFVIRGKRRSHGPLAGLMRVACDQCHPARWSVRPLALPSIGRLIQGPPRAIRFISVARERQHGEAPGCAIIACALHCCTFQAVRFVQTRQPSGVPRTTPLPALAPA